MADKLLDQDLNIIRLVSVDHVDFVGDTKYIVEFWNRLIQ